jgi:hypothetical protein
MRTIVAFVFALIVTTAFEPAHADPYRWCAEYSGGGEGGGGTNCYFVTLEQCRAAASGNGGFCRPNNFYDGRPVTTPGESYPRSRNRRAR